MLETAMTSLYALLKAAWPSGALLLHPDELVDFETAFKTNTVIVRYYQPRPATTSTLVHHIAHVDVCAATLNTAASEADKLLALIPVHARAPTGASQARPTPIREASYYRVHVTFTLIADAIEEEGS